MTHDESQELLLADKKFQNLCDAIAWADEAIANLLGTVHEGGYTILVGEAQGLADGLVRLDRMTYPLDPCPELHRVYNWG